MHGDGGAGPSGMGSDGVPRTIEWGASPDQLGAPQAGGELALVCASTLDKKPPAASLNKGRRA